MIRGFSVTFEQYFSHDDGQEVCDADDRGFVVENVSLREAMRSGLEYARPEWCGYCEPDSYPPRGVRWLTFQNWNEGTRDQIERGISETRSLHLPETLTESSRMRICRLFKAYGSR